MPQAKTTLESPAKRWQLLGGVQHPEDTAADRSTSQSGSGPRTKPSRYLSTKPWLNSRAWTESPRQKPTEETLTFQWVSERCMNSSPGLISAFISWTWATVCTDHASAGLTDKAWWGGVGTSPDNVDQSGATDTHAMSTRGAVWADGVVGKNSAARGCELRCPAAGSD